MSFDEKYASFIVEGDQYLKAAMGGLKREMVFTPEILYNLLAMAIEKYCMALLIRRGTLADNHTFVDLVASLDRVEPLDARLRKEVLELQRYQEICSLDAYSRQVPDRESIHCMIETTQEIKNFVKSRI